MFATKTQNNNRSRKVEATDLATISAEKAKHVVNDNDDHLEVNGWVLVKGNA